MKIGFKKELTINLSDYNTQKISYWIEETIDFKIETQEEAFIRITNTVNTELNKQLAVSPKAIKGKVINKATDTHIQPTTVDKDVPLVENDNPVVIKLRSQIYRVLKGFDQLGGHFPTMLNAELRARIHLVGEKAANIDTASLEDLKGIKLTIKQFMEKHNVKYDIVTGVVSN